MSKILREAFIPVFFVMAAIVLVLTFITPPTSNAQYHPPGGGGTTGATGPTGPAGATGVTGPTGSGGGLPPGTGLVEVVSGVGTLTPLTLDAGNNLNSPAGANWGVGSAKSGYQLFDGATSGSAGFSVPAVAGTAILYLLPSTAGTAGQFLEDTGSVTCPTLPTGAPSLCHQMTWASVSSGGGSSTGPIASLPGAGTSGNLFLPTNSLYDILRDNGSTWDYFYRGFKVTPPSNGSFSFNNQGSCTATAQTNGVITLNCPSNGAADNVRSYEIAAPATPWTKTFRIRIGIDTENFNNAGIALRESGTGKLVTYFFQWNSGTGVGGLNPGHVTAIGKWNSVSSFNSSYTAAGNIQAAFLQGATDLCLQVTDNGTNLIFSWSIDNGITFITQLTVARNNFFTTGPDKIGISTNPNDQTGSSLPNVLTLISID